MERWNLFSYKVQFNKAGSLNKMIYVITHKVVKNEKAIDKKHDFILHVGENKDCLSEYLRDDSGDNISNKNANYCELTGLYWIWKNSGEKDDEIVGLVHYRRFFTTEIENFKYKYLGKMPRRLRYTIIEEKLKQYDAIIPKKTCIFSTVKEFYGKFHDISDIETIRQCIGEIYPEYIDAFDKVMMSHKFTYGNMIICRKKTINQYSKWLFDILFDFETKISISKYNDTYQKRIFGFLAERLLQVWLEHNKVNCCEFPIYNTEERSLNVFDITKLRLKTAFNKIVKYGRKSNE